MEKAEEENPFESASVFSRMFYSWLHPLLKTGWKRELQESDLYRNVKDDDSEYLGNILEKEWSKELKKKNPSLLRSIIRVFGLRCLLFLPLALIQECFLLIVQAYLVGVVINYFEDRLEEKKSIAYLSAAGICASTIFFTITFYIYMFGTRRIDMKLSIACCSVIYRKALKLSHASLGKSNIGHMVNLLSNDINKFDNFLVRSFYLITGPLQIILTVIMLWQYLGYAIFAGVSLILLYVPFQIGIGRIFSILRLKTAKLSDKRIHLLNELIDGMRVIKMYTWEIPFATSIELIRRKEVKNIKKTLLLYGIPYTMGFILSKLLLFFSFFTFFLTGGKLTATIAFVTISLSLNLYRSIFFSFPEAISQISEALISIKRLQKFLLLEETDNTVKREDSRTCLNKSGVWLENIYASWNKDSEETLKNISLNALPGDLLVIVGPVGSGKTSLLMTMLGEIPILSGKLRITGKVAYSSQLPWIFSGTIRENILFGSDYNEKLYNEVLKVSALEKDICDLPEGDLTLVGERGKIMSGGQRTRINLARALYLNADVYILDDPLSAVDAPVAKHIFERCIMDHLKNKVRILVTHQIQFLKAATKIIVFEEGKVKACCDFSDIIKLGIDVSVLQEESKADLKYHLSLETKSLHKTNLDNYVQKLIQNGVQCSVEEKDVKQEIIEVAKKNSKEVAGEKKEKISRRAVAYMDYIKAGIGKIFQFGLLFLFLLTQVLTNGSDYWLVKWTNQQVHSVKNEELFEYCKKNVSMVNDTNCTDTFSSRNEKFNISVYSGLILALILSSLIRAVAYFSMCTNSSISLHNRMLRCIIRTPVTFLENNPTGKILNRFSRDMGIIDQPFPIASLVVLNTFLNIIGMIVLQTIIFPFLIIPLVILIVSMSALWIFYVRTARDIKRLEGVTRSPVFAHLSTSLYGLSTIRAFKAERNFEIAFDKYQNKHSSCKFLYLCLSHWNAEKIHMASVVNLAIIIVAMFLVSSDLTSGEIGLTISYSITIFLILALGFHSAIEMETQLTSVERVQDYSKLSSEAANTSANDKRPPKEWPQKGIIEFRNVYLQYPGEEKPVLKSLNFHIKSGEKIGIVGRTGAGKSSIITALFRMTEPTGTILIDGVAIQDIGLHELRSKISIIPQDPLLFSGSLRRNIDPFNRHDENTLWNVLEDVCLKDVVRSLVGGLDAELSEGGSNFSVGQRQLICLARAILHRNKILVLDEATANIDKETDSLIQRTIRDKFASSTILTVAHRLQTIMDSDRIMVLHDGKIEEFDEPYELLNNKGVFYKMVRMAGEEMIQHLYSVVKTTYNTKL